MPEVNNGHEIEELFGADSPLSTVLAGYFPRQEQLEMARAVSSALQMRERLVVEAGPGKSTAGDAGAVILVDSSRTALATPRPGTDALGRPALSRISTSITH